MPLEAARIASRLRAALNSESGGQETAKLAWQYAAAVEEVNAELAACAALAREGRLHDAYARMSAYGSAGLIDAAKTLDKADRKNWNAHCEAFGYRQAPQIDRPKLEALEQAVDAIADLKEWLYGAYRNAVRGKDPLKACQAIRLVAERFPEDAAAREELDRAAKRVESMAAKELQAALEELMPEASVKDVLARYRARNLPLPDKKGPLRDALKIEQAALAKEAAERVRRSVEAVEALADGDEWREAERAFLETDAFLASSGARASLDAENRQLLEQAANRLARLRSQFESDARIRQAASDARQVADRRRILRGKATPLTLREATDRLKSALSQAKKLGNRVAPEIERECRQALAYAAKRRLPKRAGLAGAGLLAVALVLWAVAALRQSRADAEKAEAALAAVEQALRQSSAQAAQTALQTARPLLEDAPDAHPELAAQTQSLQAWLDRQRELEADYAAIAKTLQEKRRAGSPDDPEIPQLVLEASEIRDALVPNLGQESQATIEAVVAWRQQAIESRRQSRAARLAQAERQAADRVEAAGLATTRPDFQKAAAQADQALEAALEAAKDAPGRSEASERIRDLRERLDQTARKWNALEALMAKLSAAETLPAYLDTLERIHSFDITPSADKAAIGRVLALRPQIEALLPRLLFPGRELGGIQLAGEEDYRKAQPRPDETEQAFLRRLANDPLLDDVYVSEVKYFEGEAQARSAYRAFLAEPVSIRQQAVRSGMNYAFLVRGFDEQGQPETEPRSINFVSRPDGSFWGFYYEPSVLSPESEYYEGTIRPALLEVLGGAAQRFTLLDLFDQIGQAQALSPAFRAYWHAQLLEFMRLNPWKWGIPLCPSLQELAQRLDAIEPGGGIPKRKWLSSVEQTAPSQGYVNYLRKAREIAVAEEAAALAALYQIALDGSLALAGHIDAKGELVLDGAADGDETIWIPHALAGRFQPYRPGEPLAPYGPALVYRLEDKPASHATRKASFLVGVDFSQEPYASSLPPLLKDGFENRE